MLELKDFTRIMIETGLNPARCYLCLLIHCKEPTQLIQYTEKFGLFPTEDLDYLIKNDFIMLLKKGSTNFLDLVVTNKFSRFVDIDADIEGKEFFNEYPNYLLINRNEVPAKAIDEEVLTKMYYKAIKGSASLHRDIMEKLKKWKEANRGYATMNIKNFVGSKHWEALSSDQGSSSSIKDI